MAYDLELAARIRAALSFESTVTEKRMFGGHAFMLAGHMVAAASGNGGLMLRVDPGASASLVDGHQVSLVAMNGHELNGWLLVDKAALGTEEQLRGWLEHALAFVRALPPK